MCRHRARSQFRHGGGREVQALVPDDFPAQHFVDLVFGYLFLVARYGDYHAIIVGQFRLDLCNELVDRDRCGIAGAIRFVVDENFHGRKGEV